MRPFLLICLCATIARGGTPSTVPRGDFANVLSISQPPSPRDTSTVPRLYFCMYEAPRPDLVNRPGVYYGVAISGDEGKTWRSSGWQIGTANDIARDPGRPGTLYLANDWGLLKSTDDGVSWKLTTDWRVQAVLAVRLSGSDVWIATATGPWKSTDGGVRWTRIDRGLPPLNGTYSSSLLVLDKRILLATADGIYRSADGERWTAAGLQGLSVTRLSLHPTDSRKLIAILQGNQLRISQDGGASWIEPPTLPPVKKIQDAVFSPAVTDVLFISSQDAGIMSSGDGGKSWKHTSTGLTNYNITALAIDTRDHAVIYAGSENGSFVSRNRGASWQAFSIRSGYVNAIRMF